MSWLQALLLGFIQGLTEFLPVSSSGHLQIGQALLGTSGEDNLSFTLVVHVATVLSTLVILWPEVADLLRGTFTTAKWNEQKDYVAKIVISMIPIFIVGMFFKDYVEQIFGEGLLVVGICLLITALLLWLSEFLSKRMQSRDESEQGHEVTYRDAIIIGLAQALAVLPGLSRSGTTIATGLLCGVKKESVARFSFLMVLVPVLGDAFLDLLKNLGDAEAFSGIPVSSLIVGFLTAFVTGCLACKFMLEIVRRQKLVYFAIYCLIAGVFAIVYNFVA